MHSNPHGTVAAPVLPTQVLACSESISCQGPYLTQHTLWHADEYVERRAGALRQAIRKHGGAKGAELPVALIENSSRAPANDAGEKLLGNKRAWLPDLMTRVSHHLSHGPKTVTQCY